MKESNVRNDGQKAIKHVENKVTEVSLSLSKLLWGLPWGQTD